MALNINLLKINFMKFQVLKVKSIELFHTSTQCAVVAIA